MHQLVTTVRGELAAGADALDAVEHAFPPGSMTGAPKRRTCELLAALEKRERGAYSGALGYLSATGACDLAVAIRTAVVAGGRVAVGAGGALTALSEPADEWAEVALKLAAVSPSRPRPAFFFFFSPGSRSLQVAGPLAPLPARARNATHAR